MDSSKLELQLNAAECHPELTRLPHEPRCRVEVSSKQNSDADVCLQAASEIESELLGQLGSDLVVSARGIALICPQPPAGCDSGEAAADRILILALYRE